MNTIVTPSPVSTTHGHITPPPVTLPGQLQVIDRNGKPAAYDPDRIEIAIKKAFLAVEGDSAAHSERIHHIASQITQHITARLTQRWPNGGTIHIESIQDLVELALMREQEHKVAQSYVIYREARRQERLKNQQTVAEQEETSSDTSEPGIQINYTDGTLAPLNMSWFNSTLEQACADLPDVSMAEIAKTTLDNLFDGATPSDVYKALIMTARTHIESEPNYSYATAKLLLSNLYNEVLSTLSLHTDTVPISSLSQEQYQSAFQAFISQGIALELLDESLADFNLDQLAQALKPSQDHLFQYLGLQTLYDRYFIHTNNNRLELPQVFFMRVAMGLAHSEGTLKNERAIEFYNLLSSLDYMSSTPTLFNSGTRRPQLSSCYLTTVPDDLNGIYSAIRDNAMLSKYAGGLGNDWTPVRAMGSHIKGTNGKSLGIVPFLNVVDATAVAVNQGGKRKGAVCAYLETWHMDIEEFLELRKNTGDERRRTHDMNTANWVPDLFMKRLYNNESWSLFSPDSVPDLHDLYGDAFEAAYIAYEQQADRGEISRRTITAKKLWRKMISMLFETGHPWVTFKDPCNIRSPQQHAGTVHSSNLCTEITLNTSAEEIAVCNLGSVNLVNHMVAGKLDAEKIKKTVKTAIRMLDNVIDINYYSVPQAEHSNRKHRPIGMGLMGFQDALYLQDTPYASEEAVEFADRCMEIISYHAIDASAELAKERGAYESYAGSLWSQGILPIDSIAMLKATRGDQLRQNTDKTLDWQALRSKVQQIGMRNSNVMAIAPTATIANICGVSQSTEPTYQNLFVKSNLSGEFTVINPYLVNDLKALSLWDTAMMHDIKYYNGSIKDIQRIPATLKSRYATAFEIDPKWLVAAASRRQKWIDQAHSLNLYMAEPSGKKLDELYRFAWESGLKSTYYLRTLAATSTEKATINDQRLNAVNTRPDVPECEACE
jgi:ribonucleoside-diphosphate reductase alpha chain